MAIYRAIGSESFPSHEDIERTLIVGDVADDALTAGMLREIERWRNEDAEMEYFRTAASLGDLSVHGEDRYYANAA